MGFRTKLGWMNSITKEYLENLLLKTKEKKKKTSWEAEEKNRTKT